jgi:hypothetical protein
MRIKSCIAIVYDVGMSSWIIILMVSKDVAGMVDSGSWFQIVIFDGNKDPL